jgi:hypothetical protein
LREEQVGAMRPSMEFKIVTRPTQIALESEIAALLKMGWGQLGGITISAKGPNRDTEYSQVLVRRFSA